MRSIFILLISLVPVLSQNVAVNTTSGRLIGLQSDGVASFKGIRFAQPPVGNLRWQPPVAFVSSDVQNATSLSPSCIQQFPSSGQGTEEKPGRQNTIPQDEDCLFLNVWAPAPTSSPSKAVVVWIYGGGFVTGTASIPVYDGTSFAKNQDVVFVSFNYRTNVFGFPTASDLPSSGNNLGFLDQELALAWVQDNIAQFGGDKCKVTIMGESAGSGSVSLAVTRRNSSVKPPFRAAIMMSGLEVSTLPKLNFSNFDTLATAMGCTQPPGAQRLQCMRSVPAPTIRTFTSGPDGFGFTPAVDNVTAFDDPLQRIRTGQIARVPILLGSTEDDGTLFVLDVPQNLPDFLKATFGALGSRLSPDVVRAQYPGLSDPQVIAAIARDVRFRCPAKLWSDAFVASGITSVYRYTYGPVFADLLPFPDAGAFHGSEVPIVFGTFNRSTATAAEVELSHSLQTAFANFAKDPVDAPPAPNWPPYHPGLPGGAQVPLVAKIAYHGNVGLSDFVEPIEPKSIDAPCAVWDQFLDFRP